MNTLDTLRCSMLVRLASSTEQVRLISEGWLQPQTEWLIKRFVDHDAAFMFAPKMSSLGDVVVTDPLLGVELRPVAPAATSSVVTPRYSRIRTSGWSAARLKVTVTVFAPLTIFGA